MEYIEFLNIANERISQGKIFSKIVYTHMAREDWRNYIMFLQPTKVEPSETHNFSPMFSVLLDGKGRLGSDEHIKGGLGISNIISIEDLTIADYIDFARCLKDIGLKFNRKLNTIVTNKEENEDKIDIKVKEVVETIDKILDEVREG
jgi:hypothetical protein